MADMHEEDLEIMIPSWKAPKISSLGSAKCGSYSAQTDFGVDKYSSVAAPYGPSDPIASTYFQVVISKAKAPIVCGDAGPIKGKAIYADRDLPRATKIWTESPLVAMQHANNRSLLPTCQYCFLPLMGDAQQQWRDIVTRYNAQIMEPTSRNQTQKSPTQKDQSDGDTSTTITPVEVNMDALDKALQVLHITPRTCGMAGPGANCVCGELYCSKLCQMKAFHEYHAILCPRNEPCSAMGEFVEHTCHTNDVFLLAAKVIARVIARYLVWRDIVKAREPIDMFYKKPWWEVVVVEHDDLDALEHLSGDSDDTLGQTTASASDETSDSSTSNDGTPPNDGQGLEEKEIDIEESAKISTQSRRQDRAQEAKNDQRQDGETQGDGVTSARVRGSPTGSSKAKCLQEVFALTHQLLIDALECNLVRLEREGQLRGVSVEEIWRHCSSILSFEFFTAQIGMFEMNNISMEVDHPFHAFIDILDPEVQHELASDDMGSDGSPKPHPQLTSEDQALLSKVRGVLEWEEARLRILQAEQRQQEQESDVNGGEFDPNMPLGFPSIEGTSLFPIICTMNHSCDPNCTVLYTKNGDGHVVAVRDIKKGEELCICYIDVDMDVKARETNLREYKFKCLCSRCVDERKELERSNRGTGGPTTRLKARRLSNPEQQQQPKKKAKQAHNPKLKR
ncbi:SET and MYND domain-containing protein 5 [Phytophthora boehmeriae]|uniref:SET and MYND domain-containing protein 5 n=1 Tax=Phytophthora boehmeriae TaxID=109152 RepID=A0A8T1WDH7_9STRA|nr:SET and MYND domain-containing protein 5 [Phytophthora boehmeriae]